MRTKRFSGFSRTLVLADGREVVEVMDRHGNIVPTPPGLVAAGETLAEIGQVDAGELRAWGEQHGSRVVGVYCCYELMIED